MILRCTSKVLDLLGESATSLTEAPPSDNDWYMNLLWVERRKCLLLTHAGTLFSVFTADVRKADLRPIGRFVTTLVQAELRSESLQPHTFGPFDSDAVRLAKTASRSTLGFMNDFARLIRYRVAYVGGLGRCDIRALNHRLRRTPCNRGEYVYPIDLVAQLAGRSD